MEVILTYKGDTSNKFWKISTTGKMLTVTYGKVGSVGAVKTKELESEKSCLKEANKLIQSKLKKGYVVAEATELVIKESSMTEILFWELLANARNKGEDPDEQLEWLITHLSRKPVKDIVMFDYFFNQNYRKSYTSNLWAAAYIIMGGCSDDSFDYFRAWLLYQGKEAYETIIKDPEKIIPYLKIVEEEGDVPEFEDLMYVAGLGFEEKTGLEDEEFFKLYHQLVDDTYVLPEMEFDWNEEDEVGLRNKFPLLWERYGEDPLG
jgi:predicted DNA-binding WGR domain protein